MRAGVRACVREGNECGVLKLETCAFGSGSSLTSCVHSTATGGFMKVKDKNYN